METFKLSELLTVQSASGSAYLAFLRKDSMSIGLYVLRVGDTDHQQPHTEDEAYYIISGRGMFFCDGEDKEVSAGTTLYVAKGLEHRFHSIAEDMQILVFFAPPEGTTG